jgi:hypothetical protein
MQKMTVTTNDGRFVADFEIGDVDPVDYQPEIDEVLREAFELEATPFVGRRSSGWCRATPIGRRAVRRGRDVYDGDPLDRAEGQEVRVGGDQGLRFPGDRTLEELVVGGVAASPDRHGRTDEQGSPAEQRDQRAPPRP